MINLHQDNWGHFDPQGFICPNFSNILWTYTLCYSDLVTICKICAPHIYHFTMFHIFGDKEDYVRGVVLTKYFKTLFF